MARSPTVQERGWVAVKANGSEVRSCGGEVRVRRRVLHGPSPEGDHPAVPSSAYYLQRTRFREYCQAEAASAAVDRGWERRDQRVGRAQSIGENPADREERLHSTLSSRSLPAIAMGRNGLKRTSATALKLGRVTGCGHSVCGRRCRVSVDAAARELSPSRLRKKSVGGASSPIRRLLPLRNPLI